MTPTDPGLAARAPTAPPVDAVATTSRPKTVLLAAIAGVLIAGSLPPWGWWPLAFAGIAMLDRLIEGQRWKTRFARTWLVAAFWLYPAMLWMFDLTAPGYLAVVPIFACFFGAAAALTPPTGAVRYLVLPGTVALAELARWSWPFGGVPLAHLAMSQVNTPVGQVARLAGPLFVVMLVVVIGQAVAAAAAKRWTTSAVAAAVVVVSVVAAFAHPRATVVDEIDVALVQGGGAQRTRASSTQEPVVLARHVEASRLIDGPVDLIIWPENVVNPGRYLSQARARELVDGVAADYGASVLAGWFLPTPDGSRTVNYHSTITPTGAEVDRYDKVILVPFGEYVPFRSLIEQLNDEIPNADVIRGEAEPVLDTPVGPVGVSISWEGFFETRARHSVREGAQVLANPTNGSSYWLTQVQSQQVASNQLRAIENDRWELQVAPTGFSAIIDPDGNVVQRTGLQERAVLQDTVEMRIGRTLANRVGYWPILVYGLLAVGYSVTTMRQRRPLNAVVSVAPSDA